MRKRAGITTKIMMKFMHVPPSAKTVLFGFSIPCTPKLKTSVVSSVTTRLPLSHSRISSLLTKRPKPNILATASILYTPDHITLHRPMPAKKLDDAVGVNMDMTHLQLADDIYVAPTTAARFWHSLVGHTDLEFGTLVQHHTYEMFEGFGIADLADSSDNAPVTQALHAIGGRARFGFQKPVENRQFGTVFPAAHREIRLVILPH